MAGNHMVAEQRGKCRERAPQHERPGHCHSGAGRVLICMLLVSAALQRKPGNRLTRMWEAFSQTS